MNVSFKYFIAEDNWNFNKFLMDSTNLYNLYGVAKKYRELSLYYSILLDWLRFLNHFNFNLQSFLSILEDHLKIIDRIIP